MTDEDYIGDAIQEDSSWANDQQGDFNDNIMEQQEESSFGSYPTAKPSESVWSFFRHIVERKDSTKVSNLDKRELGMIDLSVRSCQHLSLLGGLLSNDDFKEFFTGKGEITLATAMSKKGWLPELVVSQKRFSQRMVQPVAQVAPQKKGFFGFGKSQTQQQT